MTNYLIVDGDNKFINIFKNSVKMMQGYKWNYLMFNLSFIGWILLGIITLGIAFIYITPYISLANALYYEELKKITN